MTLTVVTNHNQRDLLAGYEIPQKVWDSEFDYLGPYAEENEETFTPRFFRYRDSWYDVNEFERATGEIAEAGFDGFQSDTYFSGIAVRYGKDWAGQTDYATVVVARIGVLD